MDNAFNGCSVVTELDVSNWDTSKVTTMWQMFQNCPMLTSLDLTGWNTSKVKNTANMFFNCSGLTELDLSSFNVKNVTNAVNMFNSCRNLETIYVSADAGWEALADSHAKEVMFASSTKLIGGAGTKYIDQNGIYARIDGVDSAPGYFTKK
jgi:surface protein